MTMHRQPFHLVYRLLQLGITLIPVSIGFLAFLNDIRAFKDNVNGMILPMITMQGNPHEAWRALPASFAPYLYTAMFIGELIVGILAAIGFFCMLKNLFNSSAAFERSKHWVYIACPWGVIVWGLGFFEGAGDWFLGWMSNNPGLTGLQQGAVMYVTELFFVFFFLKYCKEEDIEFKKL